MNERYWCAIGWGVAGFFISLMWMWNFTMLDIFGILFYAITVYIIIVGAILLKTEPKRKRKSRKLNPHDCPIQTLNRGEWEHDRTR